MAPVPHVAAQIIGDHQIVAELIDELQAEAAAGQPPQREVVEQLVTELSQHLVAEERVLFPEVRDAVGLEAAEDALAEHQDLKELLVRLDADDDVDLDELRALAIDRVADDEASLVTQLEAAVGAPRMRQLGAHFEAAKRDAPDRPVLDVPARQPEVLQ